MKTFLLVNFGGPRNLGEIESFLKELLQDRDVIRTRLPRFAHNWLFGRIAKKRALKIRDDYEEIGGKSPIYEDTEKLAAALAEKLGAKVGTFHRYLPATHAASLKWIEKASDQEIVVLPLFPQFCYATTGSIARFFENRLQPKSIRQLRWIKSYAGHPAFIQAYRKRISAFLTQENLNEEQTVLLYSAHGVPQTFIDQGDPYEWESRLSFKEIGKSFPKALSYLSYQSKFGRGEWLRPYTNEACEQAAKWSQNRSQFVFVPISFTSDHIETLFEVEKLYLPILQQKNFSAYRCPALNLEPYWIEALCQIAQETNLCPNQMLIRR